MYPLPSNLHSEKYWNTVYVWISNQENHYPGKCILFDLQIYKIPSLLKCIKYCTTIFSLKIYKILKHILPNNPILISQFTFVKCLAISVHVHGRVCDCSPGVLRGRQRRTGSCSTVWTRCSSYWESVTSSGTQSGPTIWTLSGVSVEKWKFSNWKQF